MFTSCCHDAAEMHAIRCLSNGSILEKQFQFINNKNELNKEEEKKNEGKIKLKQRYQYVDGPEYCRHVKWVTKKVVSVQQWFFYMLLLFDFLVFLYPWEYHLSTLYVQWLGSKYRQHRYEDGFYCFFFLSCISVACMCESLYSLFS